MIDNKVDTIHTPCKDCVFAVYDGQTQTDCALGYVAKYKNKNIPVLEAYDDSKEFYIINGKKCIGYRENKWFQQFGLDDGTLEAKINKYHETNHLDYIGVVDLKNLSIEDLDQLLKQLQSCEIKPRKLVMIRYADSQLKFPYSGIENLLKNNNVSYLWRIQTILDNTLTYNEILHNIISLNAKYRFILSINNYNNDIKNIVEHTNKVVHHDLDQFDIFSNKDRSCMIFSTIIYRFDAFHGNNLLNNQDNYQIV